MIGMYDGWRWLLGCGSWLPVDDLTMMMQPPALPISYVVEAGGAAVVNLSARWAIDFRAWLIAAGGGGAHAPATAPRLK